MKNVFLNIIKATFSFAKAHTAITIATASAVAVTAVAVPVGVSIAKNNNVVSAEEIEIIEETIIIDKTDVSSENNSSVEDTTSVEESPVVSEPTEEPVTSKEETPAHPQTTPSVPSQPTKPETKPEESKPTQNQTSSSTSTSGKKFVQLADPETGISWDGVSPIVYTYADGTTGTEKREGAKYEGAPGMITTIVTVSTKNEQTPSKKPRVCDECGKEKGNGGSNTCLRYWTGGGDECPCCGEHVPEDTCHTCTE